MTEARRLVIGGRVQGVGYRDWMVEAARAAGVSGWVRNRADGTVEAVICGPPDAVEALAAACWTGPPPARVETIAATPAEPPEAPGFTRRPTA